MTSTAPSPTLIQDLYARMLLTRIVDDHTWKLHTQGFIEFVASCRGHEAAQVGSAICIEVGKDFTLPYYRDLGVVLTIGMTPHEVFRTYLQNRSQQHSLQPLTRSYASPQEKRANRHVIEAERGQTPVAKTDQWGKETTPFQHWGYHKHNMVTGPAPVATQLLHAAGIAFASKLRKAPVVTVAYCGDGATTEPDFLESLRFAAQHQLPVVFICEQAFTQQLKNTATPSSCMNSLPLPAGLTHQQIDGTDVVTVYQAMQLAMQHARDGRGPILLEMHVVRSLPNLQLPLMDRRTGYEVEDQPPFIDGQASARDGDLSDPLIQCQRWLQTHDVWDNDWAKELRTRISAEIECAWHDVLHDILQAPDKHLKN
jgi:2-oxoisovalerate dehydrogenase E1 component alpha subunit